MELPQCRWRGAEISPGQFACHSNKLVVGPAGVNREVCAQCYCRDHEPAAVPATAAPYIACGHRGAAVRRTPCPSCRGVVQLNVFACALHDECTLATALPGFACCVQCSDYLAMAGAAP